MATALRDLTRPQLEKRATKSGVKFGSKWSDVKIRNAIRKAKRAGQEAALKVVEPSSNGKAKWPKDWPEEMRAEYFTHIVGKPLPKGDPKKAYRTLLKVIDQKVPDMSVTMTEAGPDCYGIYYEPTFKYCSEICPVMPLCKTTCEQRPELNSLAHNLSEAEAEVKDLTEEEVEQLQTEVKKPARTKKKTKKKKAKAASVSKRGKGKKTSDTVYHFKGKVSAYKDFDDEFVAAVVWMGKRRKRGFKFADLAKKLTTYEDSFTQEVIDSMLEDGDLIVK